MGFQPHYIANFEENGGLDRYLEPFLIPEKAFPELEDAVAWRGRIKRRDGFTHLGRLRRKLTAQALGNTAASPWTFNIFAIMGIGATEPDASLKIGTVVITIAGPIVFTDNGFGVLTSPTPGNSGTINYTTGSVTLTHTAGAGAATTGTYYYYPSLPVMGLPRQETDIINNEQFVVFDMKYAYSRVGAVFERLGTAAWSGTNYDFFWSTNYYRNNNGNITWTTNFNVADPIRYWDTVTWTNFSPLLRPDGTKLIQARILIPYKNRLLAFNTYEGIPPAAPTHYPQRLRWCQNGSPLATVANSWTDTIVGYGGYIDCPTSEQIVSVGFIKDVLMVKCERSSWKIVYTGNESLPFVFEKVNTELGAESTFSLVCFDKGIFTVGNYGITVDDSVNVSRIDDRIPLWVMDIQNDKEGVFRVHGIRDFTNELVYWNYSDSTINSEFPNKILVYNYRNNTFALYNDSFTCFGYYQKEVDLTWAELPYLTWSAWNKVWNSGITQSQFPDIAAGNQQGYVSVLNQETYNGISLSIKAINTVLSPNVFNVPNHNLQNGQFVKITGILPTGAPDLSVLNSRIYKVTRTDAAIADPDHNFVLQDSTLAFVALAAGSTYIGGGNLTVLNNINIKTKIFAPFYEQGGQARLGYIDYYLDRTDNGEITANVLIDEDDSIAMNDPSISTGQSGLLGSNKLLTRPENLTILPFQANQEKIWHRSFVQSTCQNFMIWFTMSDDQMFSEAINSSEFVLHAMTLYLSKNARMTQ